VVGAIPILFYQLEYAKDVVKVKPNLSRPSVISKDAEDGISKIGSSLNESHSKLKV
jgi:hypothetical protein